MMERTRSDDVVLMGELAKAVGVSRATASVWARCGLIPATLRGGRYELRRSDFAGVVRKHRRRLTAARG